MGLFDILKKNKNSTSSKPVNKVQATGGKRSFAPYSGQGVCDVCNRSLTGVQAYIVPNNVFYSSSQWRQLYKNTVKMMTGMQATDADIERMRMSDHSPGSAVCEKCIHMFR